MNRITIALLLVIVSINAGCLSRGGGPSGPATLQVAALAEAPR